MPSPRQDGLWPARILPRVLRSKIKKVSPPMLSEILRRLCFSPLIHLEPFHLYSNGLPILWRGAHLEREMGSYAFGRLALILTVFTNTLHVFLAYLLRKAGRVRSFNQITVGAGGLALAFKVVMDSRLHILRSNVPIVDISVPHYVAPWAELLFARLLLPQNSTLGGACGILAGTLYCRFFDRRHNSTLSRHWRDLQSAIFGARSRNTDNVRVFFGHGQRLAS